MEYSPPRAYPAERARDAMGLLTERLGHLFDASGSLTDEGRLVAVVVYVLVVLVVLRRGKKFLIHAFPSNVREYVPYRHDARGTDTVCVDCTHPRLPTLTHHKESSTPAYLKGDTSTDVVMNALTDPAGWQPMRVASKVTCNHFDVDGVLSVWACINPIAARKHETLVRAIARLGDMREMAFQKDGSIAVGSRAAAALKFCAWMNAVEALEFSKPFEGDEAEASAKKYAYFLPLVKDALEVVAYDVRDAKNLEEQKSMDKDAIETKRVVTKTRGKRLRFELGDAESRVVIADAKRLFDDTQTTVTFEHDLNVAFIETEGFPCHYYARFSVVKYADVVVSTHGDQKYEVEARYVGFVDFQSRPTTPRMDLGLLAKFLNEMEDDVKLAAANAGTPSLTWECAGFTDSGPLLRLGDPNRRLSKAQRYGSPLDRPHFSSTIPPEVFKNTVASFFRHALESIARVNGTAGGAAGVAKVGWTWKETRNAHDAVDWSKWEPPRWR
jgi:hypothetical protein